MASGREACEHYSLLPTPTSRGEPRVVSSQERQALEEGGFFFFNCSFSIIVFRRAWFTPRCFTEVGKCRGACHRNGGRGVGLAMSWCLKPPAMGKTQRRRCVGNNQSPGYLLLLSNTQIAGVVGGPGGLKQPSMGQAECIPVWLSGGDVLGFLRPQRRRDSAIDPCKPPSPFSPPFSCPRGAGSAQGS